MRIVIETIPHEKQRYNTCGDYFEKDGEQRILVSDLRNEDYEFLVAIHELAEWYLTKRRGISEESISTFDIDFEAMRAGGTLDDPKAEPGDDPHAPYQNEHNLATGIERIMAAALGVKWSDYEAVIARLP